MPCNMTMQQLIISHITSHGSWYPDSWIVEREGKNDVSTDSFPKVGRWHCSNVATRGVGKVCVFNDTLIKDSRPRSNEQEIMTVNVDLSLVIFRRLGTYRMIHSKSPSGIRLDHEIDPLQIRLLHRERNTVFSVPLRETTLYSVG